MASRHRSRELAVQFLYQTDLSPSSLHDGVMLDRFWREQARANNEDRKFFEILVRGTCDELPQVDTALEKVLENWRLGRIDKVDLSVLRVAVYELLFSSDSEKPDAPVVIDEAVEIAKKFGNQESPSFVNGILDALAKQFPEKALSYKARLKI
jgi:N utilization substance protein B